MMKYRRLSLEELNELETEFVQYLAANSIPAEDWKEWQANQPEKVNEHIEKFSDIVFEKVITKIEYLEMRFQYSVRYIKTDDEKFSAFILEVDHPSNENFDFRNIENPISFLQSEEAPEKMDLLHFSEEYKIERNTQIFQWIKQGALITTNTIFDSIEAYRKTLLN